MNAETYSIYNPRLVCRLWFCRCHNTCCADNHHQPQLFVHKNAHFHCLQKLHIKPSLTAVSWYTKMVLFWLWIPIVMLRFQISIFDRFRFNFWPKMTISIRFNSSYRHAKSFPTKFRDNRRRVVVFKATYCLYKTGRRLLIDVNSRGTSLVTNHPRTSHLQTSKSQVTTMFPRSNLSKKFIADHQSATFPETWCMARMEAVIAG